MLHDADAVADAHGFVQIVTNENDRPAVLSLKTLQLILHFGADQRIERRKGLVHQENGGLARQCARQADALFHASGKLIRHTVGIGFEPYRSESF